MTAPDLDALAALAAETRELYCTDPARRNRSNVSRVLHNCADAIDSMPALIARVRELERQVQSFDDAIYDCAVAESRAALAMRERCAQRAESAQANGSDCAAAIRALEP